MKLRAQQEKMQDKAAEMDALRAKRAMEGAEREAREKEEAEQRRLEAIHMELHEARKQQQAEKERRLAEQAKFERDEFERIIQVQMQQEEAERQRQEEEKGLRLQHASEIRQQIAAREERAMQERRDFLEEGNVVRAQIGAERKKLEKIKEQDRAAPEGRRAREVLGGAGAQEDLGVVARCDQKRRPQPPRLTFGGPRRISRRTLRPLPPSGGDRRAERTAGPESPEGTNPESAQLGRTEP